MTEEAVLLSIIVPVYNNARELGDLWNSLEKQLTRETELIFIDDGSRDESLEVLKKWQESARFPMTVVHQENAGVSAARNRGMELARGQYLTFVDADDCLAEDYIAITAGYARQGVEAVVFDSARVEEVPRGGTPRTHREESMTGTEMLREFLRAPARFGVCNLIMRRELVEAHRIRFSTGYKYYEDYDFLLQLFPRVGTVLRRRDVLYFYMLRDGSAVARFRADRVNCLELMERRGDWLETAAPEFAPEFQKWATARLYWSVLWQGALALETYADFREFARVTRGSDYLKRLKGYPDRRVRLSTAVYGLCPAAYYLAVRLVGRRKSRVTPTSLEEILGELKG